MRIPIPDDKEVLEQLGPYSEISYLSKGGFKVVYRGVLDGDEEAVKAIYIPSEEDGFTIEQIDQLIARAEREIKALKECSSPAIVKCASLAPHRLSFACGDFLVYSEELLSGQLLSEHIQSCNKPDLEELSATFKFLISVIDEMIRIGYLHRDIKPSNIFITQEQERPYVILDMGIAYKMQGTELTQGNSPPGTLRYMAPELLQPNYKDVMDFRCDLYSAALTIYEYASGVQPFCPQPNNDYGTMYRILHDKPTKLEELRPDLPKTFARIVDRCIKKKPELRYASLKLLRTELEEAIL